MLLFLRNDRDNTYVYPDQIGTEFGERRDTRHRFRTHVRSPSFLFYDASRREFRFNPPRDIPLLLSVLQPVLFLVLSFTIEAVTRSLQFGNSASRFNDHEKALSALRVISS